MDKRVLVLRKSSGDLSAIYGDPIGDVFREMGPQGQSVQEEGNITGYVFAGFDIVVENPAGAIREGVDEDGKPWRTEFQHDYGEIAGSMGVDGDAVDVFVGHNEGAEAVYIVRQMKRRQWDEYDEDKCFVGFDSMDQAREAYLAHYDDPRFYGGMIAMPVEEFRTKVMATASEKQPGMLKALVKRVGRFLVPVRAKSGDGEQVAYRHAGSGSDHPAVAALDSEEVRVIDERLDEKVGEKLADFIRTHGGLQSLAHLLGRMSGEERGRIIERMAEISGKTVGDIKQILPALPVTAGEVSVHQ